MQEHFAPSEKQLFRQGTATFIMEFENCIITITRAVLETSGSITGSVVAPSKLPLTAGFQLPTKELANQETTYFAHTLRQRLHRIFHFPEIKTIILQSLYPETTIDVHEAKLQSGQKMEVLYVCEVTIGGKMIEIAEAGFGYIEVVLALVAILDPDKAGFILFDEFLSCMHWDLAAKFVELLVKHAGDFIRYTKRVVVAVTYSPAIVPLVPISHVIHFSSNGPDQPT